CCIITRGVSLSFGSLLADIFTLKFRNQTETTRRAGRKASRRSGRVPPPLGRSGFLDIRRRFQPESANAQAGLHGSGTAQGTSRRDRTRLASVWRQRWARLRNGPAAAE